MKRVNANPDVCVGCRLCQTYCQTEHSRSRDVLKTFKLDRTPPPRIRVERGEDFFYASQCRHCAEPWCVYSCLTGALSRDPISGLVDVDAGKCVGCWTCVIACPFGAITPDFEAAHIVKCDLCPGLEVPACVANCPNKALLLVDYLVTELSDKETTAAEELEPAEVV